MDVDHCKKPSFLKCFSLTKNMDSIRLPPEWVSEHGDELPYECSLVMPNDVQWTLTISWTMMDTSDDEEPSENVGDSLSDEDDYIT
ncbi:hypothetical protein AAHA92_17601 [Salvia divinorum]|uniref:Uncharacterized protein n=1 Tax=Salvia divinorum TaxID=28513 RepID=A0ABD1H2I4_SALDI